MEDDQTIHFHHEAQRDLIRLPATRDLRDLNALRFRDDAISLLLGPLLRERGGVAIMRAVRARFQPSEGAFSSWPEALAPAMVTHDALKLVCGPWPASGT